MELPKNIKIFLNSLPLKDMSGWEIFVAIVFFLSKGKENVEIEVKQVIKNWSKTLLRKKYNSSFANRAQGYIHPSNKGKVCLTDEGVDYINSYINYSPTTNTSIIIFSENSAHTFDKHLRNIFKKASKSVEIADTYVSSKLFDNLLDEIPKNIPIKFLYKIDTGGFIQRAKRFETEYSFSKKDSQNFHDRFIIIDGMGYIIGPSLKDAADKKPAILVTLGKNDSKKIVTLFVKLWDSK